MTEPADTAGVLGDYRFRDPDLLRLALTHRSSGSPHNERLEFLGDAVLGLVIEESLNRLNALKQAVAFAVNVAAATFFLFSGQVVWTAAVVMAIGAIIGGVLGGRLAGTIKPNVLRTVVITIGVIVAIIYLVR